MDNNAGYALIAACLVTVLLILGLIIHIRRENKRFRVTQYELYSDKLRAPLTLAVLADLHSYVYGDGNSLLFDAIKKAEPDLVISAGDMITGSRFAPRATGTFDFLARLCESFDFVYGCGNHEHKLIREKTRYPGDANNFEQGLERARATLQKRAPGKLSSIEPLDNRCIDREDLGVRIYGLNLEREYFEKFIVNMTSAEHINSLVGKPGKDTYNILIGHNPDQFDAYVAWGADLVLSGHVHGGMIATPWHRGLISPRLLPFPKYDRGVYKKEGTTMVLSGGLGNHTVHVRLFNRAELVIIKLWPSK